jgi:hypothetical protein
MEAQITEKHFGFSVRKYFPGKSLRRRREHASASWIRVVPLTALFMLTGCARKTLFRSNFEATPINQPPAHTQAIGTATTEGSVVVAPLPETPSIKGVRFDPISSPNSPTALHCELLKHPADGTYVFSTLLYIPSKSAGIVTISFERSPKIVSPATAPEAALGGGQAFMHLDFLGDSVRIDDDVSTTFGKFSRDQVFIVQVTLNLNASPSAHIVLSGAGASGEVDRNLSFLPPTIPLQFGAVRIWTNLTADIQTFYAANIVVTRNQ